LLGWGHGVTRDELQYFELRQNGDLIFGFQDASKGIVSPAFGCKLSCQNRRMVLSVSANYSESVANSKLHHAWKLLCLARAFRELTCNEERWSDGAMEVAGRDIRYYVFDGDSLGH